CRAPRSWSGSASRGGRTAPLPAGSCGGPWRQRRFEARVRGPRGGFRSDRGDFFLVRHAERGAAAAGRDHVRVLDLEAGALQAVDEVDRRAADVRQALAVDEERDALVLEQLVAVALLVEGPRVLEARAPAAAHAD